MTNTLNISRGAITWVQHSSLDTLEGKLCNTKWLWLSGCHLALWHLWYHHENFKKGHSVKNSVVRGGFFHTYLHWGLKRLDEKTIKAFKASFETLGSFMMELTIGDKKISFHFSMRSLLTIVWFSFFSQWIATR